MCARDRAIDPVGEALVLLIQVPLKKILEQNDAVSTISFSNESRSCMTRPRLSVMETSITRSTPVRVHQERSKILRDRSRRQGKRNPVWRVDQTGHLYFSASDLSTYRT
jgi:hypothetical protein